MSAKVKRAMSRSGRYINAGTVALNRAHPWKEKVERGSRRYIDAGTVALDFVRPWKEVDKNGIETDGNCEQEADYSDGSKDLGDIVHQARRLQVSAFGAATSKNCTQRSQ